MCSAVDISWIAKPTLLKSVISLSFSRPGILLFITLPGETRTLSQLQSPSLTEIIKSSASINPFIILCKQIKNIFFCLIEEFTTDSRKSAFKLPALIKILFFVFLFPMASDSKIDLKGMTPDRLKEYFLSIGEQRFRGEQVFNWIHNHLVTNFEEMRNLSKEFRVKLAGLCHLDVLQLITSQASSKTQTIKYLFKTNDGKNIESVLIPDRTRNTLCISTQVGCPLDCKFCATGLMGYKRNLTTSEIVEQYLSAARQIGKEHITNIVYMGMGEPLLNFERTVESLRIFTHEKNTGISRNRITVSTAGIPHKIKELADSGLRVKLALSLHSCFENIRSSIMPVNEKYSLKQNIDACRYYTSQTNTRMTFEYTMIKGMNDRDDDVKALTKLCRQLPSKINVIPFNSIKHMKPGGISAELESSYPKRISQFVDMLRNNNITVMIRDTQGDDIAAACGQLAVNY